ncbi:MAG: Asp-tRNA(Asn)/Glu-tRNA(Gln) amidotransferase subunit GatC [Elusimicrobia bacterium]|nr:Asp-tRNA(Asn)/Glu-tRNA(Gln) amidotransferase subunit GatC [Elusimicrobiota bacterium]
MEITTKEVEHVAKLARLTLGEEEKNRLVAQLRVILTSMEELKKLDTSKVPPTSQVLGLKSVMREDKVVPFEDREAILKNAPVREFDLFKVKKVIE